MSATRSSRHVISICSACAHRTFHVLLSRDDRPGDRLSIAEALGQMQQASSSSPRLGTLEPAVADAVGDEALWAGLCLIAMGMVPNRYGKIKELGGPVGPQDCLNDVP
jgi:hypothetical protein